MTGSIVEVMVYLDDGTTKIYQGLFTLVESTKHIVKVNWLAPGKTECQLISFPRSRVQLTYVSDVFTANEVAKYPEVTRVDLKDLKPWRTGDTRLRYEDEYEVVILEQLTQQQWHSVSYPRDQIAFIVHSADSQPE